MANKVQTPTNSVNDAHKTYRQSRTTFPMTYLHYTTELYGLLNPFFAMEGVEGDTIPLNSLEDLRTHTLQAPLMSKVSKNKDYYVVPMRAILPKTFEMIYANPTQLASSGISSPCVGLAYIISKVFGRMARIGTT